MTNPEPCEIEILEVASPDRSGQIIVVRVTLTLYARRVTIGHEQRGES